MVAHQAADYGKRVVVKQHLGGRHQVIFLEQPDHFRNIGMDRTAFPAPGLFALETPVGFFQFVNGHRKNLVSFKMVFFIVYRTGRDSVKEKRGLLRATAPCQRSAVNGQRPKETRCSPSAFKHKNRRT
jgi:hypothetical protein